MKTALLALLLLFCACGDDDNHHGTQPDAALDAFEPQDCNEHFPGWRDCSWPYHEGDDCRVVCCESDDTWTDQETGSGHYGTICSISNRPCTLVHPPMTPTGP